MVKTVKKDREVFKAKWVQKDLLAVTVILGQKVNQENPECPVTPESEGVEVNKDQTELLVSPVKAVLPEIPDILDLLVFPESWGKLVRLDHLDHQERLT